MSESQKPTMSNVQDYERLWELLHIGSSKRTPAQTEEVATLMKSTSKWISSVPKEVWIPVHDATREKVRASLGKSRAASKTLSFGDRYGTNKVEYGTPTYAALEQCEESDGEGGTHEFQKCPCCGARFDKEK